MENCFPGVFETTSGTFGSPDSPDYSFPFLIVIPLLKCPPEHSLMSSHGIGGFYAKGYSSNPFTLMASTINLYLNTF